MMFYEMTLFPKLFRPATLLVPVTIQEQWTKILGLGMFRGLLLLHGDCFTTPWWQDPGFPSVSNQEIPWDFGLSTETPGFLTAAPCSQGQERQSHSYGQRLEGGGKRGGFKPTAFCREIARCFSRNHGEDFPQGWAAPPQKNISRKKAGVFFLGGGYRFIFTMMVHIWYTVE